MSSPDATIISNETLKERIAGIDLIGIRGVMGAGKDTLADLIVAHNPDFAVRKFATKLREAASALLGGAIPADQMSSAAEKAVSLAHWGWTFDAWIGAVRAAITAVCPATDFTLMAFLGVLGRASADRQYMQLIPKTVGALLQVLGTECFRNHVGENVWVDTLFSVAPPRCVVADVRFPNESAAVRERGGVVVLVHRKDATRNDGRSVRHASETALDGEPADVTLDNDGTPEEMYTALVAALGACH